MDTQFLIDSIVRQTMVLIAQLSTTAGVKSPLSHVADQIFVDLVDELERQGVGRKVIADMFGLALRSYQQKVQRLRESATDRGVTLWMAVHQFLQSERVVMRARVLERFRRDEPASVRSILADLVSSGLAYRTGRGDSTVFRVAEPEDLAHAAPAIRRRGTSEKPRPPRVRYGPCGLPTQWQAAWSSKRTLRRSSRKIESPKTRVGSRRRCSGSPAVTASTAPPTIPARRPPHRSASWPPRSAFPSIRPRARIAA